MSVMVCPVCDEEYDRFQDGCGTESCQARRVFVRQAALLHFANQLLVTNQQGCTDEGFAWREAESLWNRKPEGM